MAVIYTDNFTRADQNPLTTPWTTVTGATACQIVGNRVRGASASGVRAEARYGSFTLSEMKTTITVPTFQNNVGPAALVRQSATTATSYGCYPVDEFVLAKQVAFSYTEIARSSGHTPTAGQTVGCQALGSTIKGFKNGVEVVSQSDSVIATGTWGIDASAFVGAAVSDCEIDDVVLEAFEPFFVAAGTAGAAASGNITPGTPGATDPHDLEVNDIVVMAYHGSDQVAVTVPGAWTQIVQGNGGGTTSRLGVWWLRYAGGAFPSALITHASGQSPIAGIATFRNCPTSGTPFTAGTIAAGTVANIDHNGITPGGTANALLLAINGSADDNARTLLAGYTNVFQNASNNAFITALGTPDGSVSMFFKSVPLSATGTITVAQAAADPWASVLVALHQAVVVVDVPITPTKGTLTATGIASELSIWGPHGTFGPTRINAAFLPSRRYGSFAGRGGAVNFAITPSAGALIGSGIASATRLALFVTPPLGQLNASGIASPVSRGFIIVPSAGTITATGFAPVLVRGTVVVTLLGGAGFTGISSTLFVENIIRGPPVTGLALTGNPPTVSQGALIVPPAGSLSASGLASTQGQSYFITPPKGGLTATGLLSSVVSGAGILIVPPVANLAATGIAASTRQALFITPPAGIGSFAGTAGSAGLSYLVTPPRGDLTSSGVAPNVVAGAGILSVPTFGSAALSGFAPTVKLEQFVTVPVGTLTATGIASGLSRSITPPVGSLAATGIAPSVAQAMLIIPPVGIGSFSGTTPFYLTGNVELTQTGALSLTGTVPLIQLVFFVPRGALTLTGNNANVVTSGVQTQKTQLGPRFIPQKRYKLSAFANKAGNTTNTTVRGTLAVTGFAPTTATGAIPARGSAALTGFSPGVSITTLGDRTITPPRGSLSATGSTQGAIIGAVSAKKTTLGSRFLPMRRYGNFGSKAGINISVTPPCSGGVRINYLVDSNGNYLVDENGNYIVSYDQQANTTAVFGGLPARIQVSVLAGITISPTRGSLSASSTPSTALTARFITPPKGDLAATGRAPGASRGFLITPPAGSLSATGIASNFGVSYNIAPSAGLTQATGRAPTIFTGAAPDIGIARGNLTASGNSPVVGLSAIVPQGQASISGSAPIVSISTVIIPPSVTVFILGQFPRPSRSEMIFPPAGSLSVGGNPATGSANTIVLPAAGLIGATSTAPTVISNRITAPSKGDLTATGNAPAVKQNFILQPGSGSLTASGNTPRADQSYFLTIPAGSLQLTGQSPTGFAGAGQVFIIPRGDLDFTSHQPTTATSATCGQGQASFAGFAPAAAISTVLTPAVAGISIAGQAPISAVGRIISPQAGSLSIAGSSSTVARNLMVAPPSGSISFVGQDALLTVPYIFTPETGELEFHPGTPLTKQPKVVLIELRGAAVADLALNGKLIGHADFTGAAVGVVVVTK
jgi:hypothetical protein